MKTHPWAVFEQVGYTDERLISEWSTYYDAWCAMTKLYTSAERDELHVDIMRWDNEQNNWTTEY